MKVHFVSMVYCNARVFAAGMEALHRTVDMKAMDAHHTLMWQHYPLNGAATMKALQEYGASNPAPHVRLLDAGRNLGLHDGLQYMVDQIAPADDDVVIGFDPDENPLRVGWANAMVDVFKADPTCGWISLMSPPARDYMAQHGCNNKEVAGHYLQVPGYSLINTLCAWTGRAIKAMGKFTEPHAYYGGFEGDMMPKTMAAGYWIGWLRDFEVAPLHNLADPEYQLYKRHHVGFAQPLFPGSFADWITSRGVS